VIDSCIECDKFSRWLCDECGCCRTCCECGEEEEDDGDEFDEPDDTSEADFRCRCSAESHTHMRYR